MSYALFILEQPWSSISQRLRQFSVRPFPLRGVWSNFPRNEIDLGKAE